MSSSNKLEDCKKEIRSILISYQKGCYLSEFNRAYRDLIGKKLPFREVGFRSDIEFLYSMPDVVKITPTRTGEYHLLAIADDKSKHIQKMVARQKPAKLKPPVPSLRHSRTFNSYNLPPRFTEIRKAPQPKIYQKAWPKESNFSVENTPKLSNFSVEHTPKESKFSVENVPKVEPKSPLNISPLEEVISLIKHFNNGLAIDDVLCEYKRMYNKSLTLSKYGFSSIEECISDIPELEIISKNNVTFVRYLSESQVASDNGNDTYEFSSNKNLQSNDKSSYKTYHPETLLTLNTESNNNHVTDNIIVPLSLREKLQKIAVRFPDGIWASEFPSYFEEVCGHSFELCDLGYRCLSDLIDNVPDILVRKPLAGSRKDYIIYSADHFKSEQNEYVSGHLSVDHVVSNLRKILESYPEGVKLDEVLNIYSINYKDSLYIQDFGFSDIETFLLSIKNLVPLKIDVINGEKSIHLVKLSESPVDLYYVAPEACNKEAIPFDAVFPEFQYKPFTFPADFDFSKFIPSYTSSVAHAGHIYIQPQIEDEAEAQTFIKFSAELNKFYNGSHSDKYLMKNIHIKVGSSCIAKWPYDQHWYRAEVLSIPSMENVQVIYVDYGTRDTIPLYLLRYARKQYVDLPVQAIRCRLAYLKPPNNATKWDIQSRNHILKMCEDVAMMAKIEEIEPDGVHSILLCDTNGDEDIYINDVLRNEGLADYDVADPSNNITVLPEPKVSPEYHHNLNPVQASLAQYYLQAFATVAPSFAQNENYLKLFSEVTIYCQNSDPLHQNISVPFVPPPGPPGFNSVLPNMNTFSNASTLYNALPGTSSALNVNTKPKVNIIPPPVSSDYFNLSHAYESSNMPTQSENLPEDNIDNEIFDDDDEMFQQFCQKVSSSALNIRYVKRVILGDGYKIHIIVVDSKPYASSGDISQLIWNNKEADYLLRRLQVKDVDIPAITLSEDGNEELFEQLVRYNVKGVQKTTGFKSSIVLYSLKTVIKILNLFGHPSVTLRKRLTEEITSFNPNDSHWNACPDNIESDDEDSLSGVTDDDKLERLCLFDLLAMKESIMCKRKKMLTNIDSNRSGHSVEITKLEQLYEKVLQRIQEIKEICKVFKVFE